MKYKPSPMAMNINTYVYSGDGKYINGTNTRYDE